MYRVNKNKSEIVATITSNKPDAIHVAVVMGGLSAEREVSLKSGAGVLKALAESNKYNVTAIDMGADIAQILSDIKPDVVFNALHGEYGEDGCLPGLLEIIGIPYTHSGVLASSIGMNKLTSIIMLNMHGIRTPNYKVISKDDNLIQDPMKRPYVVKPIDEGSSLGVVIVKEGDSFSFANYEWEYGSKVLVEEYIPGKELSVGIIQDKAIGIIELRANEKFYDYKAKYSQDGADHIMPAEISVEAYNYILNIAEKVHKVIGAKSVSRVDVRYNDSIKDLEKAVNILEINTHPGLTELSLLPEIAAYKGISYMDIIDLLIKEAVNNKSNILSKCA